MAVDSHYCTIRFRLQNTNRTDPASSGTVILDVLNINGKEVDIRTQPDAGETTTLKAALKQGIVDFFD